MSSNLHSHLILDLDANLRSVLKQPTLENIHSCCSLIRQCHYRCCEEENVQQDDSLYVPAILVLRQFHRCSSPAVFDKLLEEFITLFKLMPISTNKILDDLLCIISIILTKRIMITNDEVQQDLFIRFFHAFCLTAKSNSTLFYNDFLGNFNQNLPIIGHYLSCLLQLYEKINTLDYRLNIIDTFWLFIYVEKHDHDNEHQLIIGQVLACFLPGILKTFSQDIGSIHQRLSEASLILLSYIIRISITLSPQLYTVTSTIKNELRDIITERNENWLVTVDTHLAPLLQRFTKDCASHDSFNVRQALAYLMLTILYYCSTWLKLSANIALKTLLVLVSSTNDHQDELVIIENLLKKLFQLPIESMSSVPITSSPSKSSLIAYKVEFMNEILNSSKVTLPDRLLIECQSDLFQLLNQQHLPSTLLTDRRWRLKLFIGYYRFIHRHIDFLFDMDTFTDQFFRFILNSLDFDELTRNNLNLLHASSLSNDDNLINSNEHDYQSVYKRLKSDVHDEIQQMIILFTLSHADFIVYLFAQIDQKKITIEINQKIFYLLSILFESKTFDQIENYQLLLLWLSQLICDDDQRKSITKRRKYRWKKEEPVSIRNLTIYLLLQCMHHMARIDQVEYLIEYIPLLLLCHSSKYTIVHESALYCLRSVSRNLLSSFLVTQSEYIIDSALKRLQTSSYDGYLILIEFIRLGSTNVINLPIMTHVIEQLLLELSCLPSIECIQLTFEFFNIFCQQVFDIVNHKTAKTKSILPKSISLIEFTINLQKQYKPMNLSSTDDMNTNDDHDDENETKPNQHPWHKMLVSIVDVFQHFISHSDKHIRSYVLDAFPSLAHVLSTIDENLFLPLVHKIWPGLIHRLCDTDFNVRIRCLTTVKCLCHVFSDFVDRRIRQDILPILIQHLESNRLIPSSKKLEYRYTKCLLTNIASILNNITINFDDVERLVRILFQYLEVESLATNAYEQLMLLTEKYSDILWLVLNLYDEDEYRKGYFERMKVYKPEPMINIDPKWKSNLLVCLAKC